MSNPWGHFKGTWQLPDKISKFQAKQLSAPHACESRWAKPVIGSIVTRDIAAVATDYLIIYGQSKQRRSLEAAADEEPGQPQEETKVSVCVCPNEVHLHCGGVGPSVQMKKCPVHGKKTKVTGSGDADGGGGGGGDEHEEVEEETSNVAQNGSEQEMGQQQQPQPQQSSAMQQGTLAGTGGDDEDMDNVRVLYVDDGSK